MSSARGGEAERAAHIEWCRARAIATLDRGWELTLRSLSNDLNLSPLTQGHQAVGISTYAALHRCESEEARSEFMRELVHLLG